MTAGTYSHVFLWGNCVFARLSSGNQSTYSVGPQVIDTHKKIRSFGEELIAHNLLACLSGINRTSSGRCPTFASPLNSYHMDVHGNKSTGLGSCQSCRPGWRIAEPGQTDGIHQTAFHSSVLLPWQRHLDEALL